MRTLGRGFEMNLVCEHGHRHWTPGNPLAHVGHRCCFPLKTAAQNGGEFCERINPPKCEATLEVLS